jgi:basic membrane protein A
MSLSAGQILNNRYRIVRLLGEGGFGAVYRAWDTSLKQPCAVKENLDTRPEAQRQFEREAIILAGLRHPGLPRVFDHFILPGQGQYLVMDYVEGEDLQSMINRTGEPLPESQILEWVSQVCQALIYLHSHHPPVIHRDIKPANIRITPQGQAILVDFGIAKLFDPNLKTTVGARAVTPGYSPPEQYGEGATDAQSDVYALGATVYHLLTGHEPPASMDIVSGVVEPPRSANLVNPAVSPGVSAALEQAMEINRSQRLKNILEFKEALATGLHPTLLGEQRQSASPTAPATIQTVQAHAPVPVTAPELLAARSYKAPRTPAPAPRATKRLPVWIWGLGGLLLVGIVAIAIALGGQPGHPKATSLPIISNVPTPTPGQPQAASTATYANVVTDTPQQVSIIPEKQDCARSEILCVGLVTDVGGVNDKSFNQSAWAGVQKGATEFGYDAKYIESKQPTDYEKNIDQFATEKYDVIITVGFMMGDATAAKAKQYPNIKFAIIDNAYFPTKDSVSCPDTVKDCYDDGGLKNVTSLMFQEDQVGYLAGVLAAGMTKTGTVCTVSGMEIPPVVRFVVGYQNGAKWMKSDVQTLNVYIPSFTDPAKGKETGESMIGQGCDVIFGVGGNTGNGGLLAAKEKGLMAIGVDVDQYNTYPEVKDALLSSAAKNVDAAVYNYLKTIKGKTDKAGILTANLQNGGVGLAPFHDWDSKIPDAVKAKIQEASKGLIDGTIQTGYIP